MGCVSVGTVFALAVFLQPMAIDTGWSRAGISGAMTLAFLSMALAGFGWGALSDRWGPRPVVLIGAVLLGLANVLASRGEPPHSPLGRLPPGWAAPRGLQPHPSGMPCDRAHSSCSR